MKKSVAITTGVIIVGAGAWLGTTWYTGQRIEEESHIYLAQANEQLAHALPGFSARLEQDSYARGFFSSQARYSLILTSKTDDSETLRITIKNDIGHGPFPAGAITRGHLLPTLAYVHSELENNELLKPLFELSQGKPVIWSDVIMGYRGNANSSGGIAPLSYQDADNSFTFSGATFDSVYDLHKKTVKGGLNAETLTVSSQRPNQAPVHVSLTGLSADMDNRVGKFGLSIGNTALKIKALEISDPDVGNTINLDNIGYSLALSEDDTNLSGTTAYTIGKLRMGSDDFGGGELAISAKHLNGETLKALSESYQQLLRNVMADDTSSEASQAQVSALLENGNKLLAGNPVIAIDKLVWRNGAGDSLLTMDVELTQPKAADGSALDFTQYSKQFALQAIKRVNADLRLSKPMVAAVAEQVLRLRGTPPEQAKQEADEQVQTLAGLAEMMNIGKNDGDNIVSKFTYADGRGELNGKEVPVADLLADAMGSDGMDDDDEIYIDSFDTDLLLDLLDQTGYDYQIDAAGRLFTLKAEDLPPTEIRGELICAPDCTILRMTAVYGSSKASAARIKEWNEEYGSFAEATIDKKGHAVLQLDIDASDTIELSTVEDLLQTFLGVSEEFAEYYAVQ